MSRPSEAARTEQSAALLPSGNHKPAGIFFFHEDTDRQRAFRSPTVLPRTRRRRQEEAPPRADRNTIGQEIWRMRRGSRRAQRAVSRQLRGARHANTSNLRQCGICERHFRCLFKTLSAALDNVPMILHFTTTEIIAGDPDK